MSSEFGKQIKVSVFGESHGEAIGCVIDNLPAGEEIDLDELYSFMARRKPGGRLATQRKETDAVRIVSGFYKGRTTGSPLCALIKNSDAHSSDYLNLADTPRPAHADYTARIKYGGFADMRGGGHFSGRLTAPVCIAGGIAIQMLRRRGIFVGAHLYSVGSCRDTAFEACVPSKQLFDQIAAKELPVINDDAGLAMRSLIEKCAENGDSVGGITECAVIGLPAGLGSPMFGGVESRLSSVIFGIPAVKGIEFGAGFGSAGMNGSQNNDPFVLEDGKIRTTTNNHGGILGGITSGMPLIMRAAFKPTPSISTPQQSVNMSSMNETELQIRGRHDPCVAVRAVPVTEAATACVILDMLTEENL